MLNITNGMRTIARKMHDEKIKHIKDGVYDFFTSNFETIAVTYRAEDTDSYKDFTYGDFAIIDNYDL